MESVRSSRIIHPVYPLSRQFPPIFVLKFDSILIFRNRFVRKRRRLVLPKVSTKRQKRRRREPRFCFATNDPRNLSESRKHRNFRRVFVDDQKSFARKPFFESHHATLFVAALRRFFARVPKTRFQQKNFERFSKTGCRSFSNAWINIGTEHLIRISWLK